MPAATKESFGRVLQTLVRKYEADRDTYLSSQYNEFQTRSQFISPLLEALGWDVRNEAGVPYHLCEVWEEKGETHGRPDYTLRINGQTKFFLEAKSPSDELSSADILQTKRYAWNAARGDVFFAGICDFEQFRFFDASLVPSEKSPLDGEAFHLLYNEYDSKIATLWELSRERVAAGSLDQFLKKDRKSLRQRAPLDEAFLNSLTEWRQKLANAIHAKNHQLDAQELNDFVQRLLDRIIFIRIAEDRKVIEQRQLWEVKDYWEQSGGRRNIMDFLVDLFKEINENFNGEIFKPHPCEKISLESAVVAGIIRELYPPKSNYFFNIVPVELLGSIYERYLGHTLNVTPRRVEIEPKPEVRKAGGVYYTPQYVVDYIVKTTVGRLVNGKTLKEVERIRILDPACGSGSFLLGAFQYLIDHYIRFLTAHPEEARKDPLFPDITHDESGKPHLSVVRKAEILRNNLYGVDIDPQAVEVTMMSLYLKAIEGERSILPAKHRLLPPLKGNIRCGNSLVEPDIEDENSLSPEVRLRVNPFNWNSREDGFGDIIKWGGFDAVIGNPPYIDSELMTQRYPEERAYCTSRYEAASGNWDIFCVFIERALQMCKRGGLHSFIVPNKLMSADYSVGARKVIRENLLVSLRDYSKTRVFPVAVYPIVYVINRSQPRPNAEVEYQRMERTDKAEPSVGFEKRLPLSEILGSDNDPWLVSEESVASALIRRLSRDFPRLETTAIVCGAATVAEAYVLQRLILEKPRPAAKDIKLVNSGTIDRYANLWGIEDCRYLGGTFLHPVVPAGSLGRMPAKRLEQSRKRKLIIAGMTRRLECIIDLRGDILAGKSTSLVFPSVEIRYLLAIMNSRLMDFYFKTLYAGNALSGGYLRIGPPQLKQLPIRLPDHEKASDRLAVGVIVSMVDKIQKLNSQLALEKSVAARSRSGSQALISRLENKISEIDTQIDTRVYELYGVTKEEREIIEAKIEVEG